DGTGLIWTDLSAEATARKRDWVRDAAKERFDSIELNCNVFEIEITDDTVGAVERLAARFGCTPPDLHESPHIWVGSVAHIAEQLRERRRTLGISYYAILGDLELLAAGAPIVAELAGT